MGMCSLGDSRKREKGVKGVKGDRGPRLRLRLRDVETRRRCASEMRRDEMRWTSEVHVTKKGRLAGLRAGLQPVAQDCVNWKVGSEQSTWAPLQGPNLPLVRQSGHLRGGGGAYIGTPGLYKPRGPVKVAGAKPSGRVLNWNLEDAHPC